MTWDQNYSFPAPPAWMSQALCTEVDPEAFFPEHGERNKDAKRVCAKCDVRAECLDYALDNNELYGVWGGLSGYERTNLRRTVA
jgi:WhiB family redox-sensing transcriptional regulator